MPRHNRPRYYSYDDDEDNYLRRYGYLKCKRCHRKWESSHVYVYDEPDVDYNEEQAAFGQKCNRCKRVNFPYRIEPLKCSMCNEIDCVCSQEDIEDRHIDQRKPHLSHLCMKCKAGLLCTNDRRGHCEC